MTIKTQKVDPRAEGGARILIKESDRDVSSLEKSSTDTYSVSKRYILSADNLMHFVFCLMSSNLGAKTKVRI